MLSASAEAFQHMLQGMRTHLAWNTFTDVNAVQYYENGPCDCRTHFVAVLVL